jgi:hypothetical protein
MQNINIKGPIWMTMDFISQPFLKVDPPIYGITAHATMSDLSFLKKFLQFLTHTLIQMNGKWDSFSFTNHLYQIKEAIK